RRTLAAFLLLGLVLTVFRCALAAAYQFLDDDAEPQVDVTFALKTASTGGFTCVFDYRDARNFYAVDCTAKAISLRAVVAGRARGLATATPAWQPLNKITLKRRAWLMQVIVNHRVVLTAYDATFDSGQIGAAGSGGWGWQDTRVQPVEPLYFADDFTRAEGQNSDWKAAAGRWTLTASSERISTRNVEMSANPFSYQAAAPASTAFAHVGRWFWDNYDAGVAVRPARRGTVGLAVYVQDARNYLAFLWSSSEGPAARQLVRVRDGKTTVLAKSSGAFLPRQWYRLGVRTSPGYVEAFIDANHVLQARNDGFGQGAVGLLAQNITEVNFDDVRVQNYDYYRQDFSGATGAAWTGGAWESAGGAWRAHNGVLASASAPGDNGATRLFLTGRDSWSGYQLVASARTGQAGACGLVAGYHDKNNYTVFRWAGARSTLPFRGRWQLMRYRNGKATIVSDEPLGVLAAADAEGFVRLRLRFAAGSLTVYSGSYLVAQLADESSGAGSLKTGRPGLWAQGRDGVAFRDVVMFFPPEPRPPKVAPKMEADEFMAGWASPSGEWPAGADTPQGREYWNTGQFFGDTQVELPWYPALYGAAKLEFAFGARRGDFNSGMVVAVQGVPAKNALRSVLQSGANVLKEVEIGLKEIVIAAGPDDAESTGLPRVPLSISLEGRALMVAAGARPMLSYLRPAPSTAPAGTSLAVRAGGMAAGKAQITQSLRAFSSNRDDYTFSSAPTDWYAPSGDWSVISRWPCYSDWSFFGGQGLNPVLWNKRVYAGDTIVELYAHPQMDLPKEIGYSHPGDLNITLAGDGKNPASGYSFVLAGWDNTKSAILKGNRIVADSRSGNARFQRPINHNAQFHKQWFYIRAEARRAQKNGTDGVQLRLLVNDELIVEYFDAAPLPAWARGGRMALWTVDSTIMVARAKVENESPGGRALPSGLLDATASPPALSSGENFWTPRPVVRGGLAAALVEGDASTPEPVWAIRNPASGGDFAVRLIPPGDAANSNTPWAATDEARLELDLTLPAEVKIDLYAQIAGVQHLIALTNAGKPDARMRLLGNAKSEAADGNWRHFSFDLGAALKKMYPAAQHWNIEEITLGALHGDAYRWLGFDGNALGSAYRVRGIRLSNERSE
ncbi:MAG TPA: hypothetical protein VNA16_09245, partial [Abditibacteriaceae bacterium]|nr:hypothetical protein [Abditibacteriaceae bacterium]